MWALSVQQLFGLVYYPALTLPSSAHALNANAWEPNWSSVADISRHVGTTDIEIAQLVSPQSEITVRRFAN